MRKPWSWSEHRPDRWLPPPTDAEAAKMLAEFFSTRSVTKIPEGGGIAHTGPEDASVLLRGRGS